MCAGKHGTFEDVQSTNALAARTQGDVSPPSSDEFSRSLDGFNVSLVGHANPQETKGHHEIVPVPDLLVSWSGFRRALVLLGVEVAH